MSEEVVSATAPQEQQKTNDKEYNFRALENKAREFERKAMEAERRALEAEKKAQEALQTRQQPRHDDEDDDDNEPYVDHKRLSKKLSSFERKMEEKIDKRAEEKAFMMVQKERQDSWLRSNSDFYDVMQHANKLAEQDPELAETILAMPEGFERQKLVYKNIKTLGLHKPKVAEPSIQQKIDANQKSPYYQPTGVGSAPYSQGGDFSPAGQKQAYSKLQELKSRLRI